MNQIRVRRTQKEPPVQISERQIQKQLSSAAGTEQFQHRDPLYHVTESFQQTFDLMGRSHAAELGGAPPSQIEEMRRQEQNGNSEGSEHDPTDMSSSYQRKDPSQQDMLRRFSETAFQRGNLVGGVIRGTGQLMLLSCLKKTVGQSQPTRSQQRKLFEGGSQHRNVPGHSPDRVIFNRGFTDSAVGLVVDTLRDARRTVESMTDLAQGGSDMGASGGAETMRKMYPFLDDQKERALLEQYRTQLEQSSDLRTRQVLQSAAVRTRALIDKKAQMKAEFISKLRFLSDRAIEALDDFTQPEFSERLTSALEAELEEAPPHEDGNPPDDLPGAGGEEGDLGGTST